MAKIIDSAKLQAKGITIDRLIDEIKHELENGHHVRLSGFGNFILKQDKSRKNAL